jgi:hypothetical protein
VAHAGAGAGISFIEPSSNDGHSSQGVVFVYHWHSFHSGWGPSLGLDWHSTDYSQTIGSVSTTLGTLQTRALLVGYGHTQKLKRFATSANVNAGYSFNNYSVASGAGSAFATGGISLVGVNVDNSWVVRPDVSAWYDVFKHVAVGVSAAYLWSRPDHHRRFRDPPPERRRVRVDCRRGRRRVEETLVEEENTRSVRLKADATIDVRYRRSGFCTTVIELSGFRYICAAS